MDFLSIILAVLGWSREHSAKVSDRKTEAYRLNAEVGGECLRSLDLLALATPPLVRRLEVLYPGQPEVYKGCTDTLAALQSQYQQLYAMAETNKSSIEKGSGLADWDKAVRLGHQWRSTASAFYPHVENVLKQFEIVVSKEEQRMISETPQPPPSFPSRKDRGWDAPPL